jgi:uncharacterized membrane protein
MGLANLPAAFAISGVTSPGSAALYLMLMRWVHFLAGITWVGLLYFFNLVNVPFMKELDAATKGKVVPSLMPRALWWFRWSAVITVLAGLAYWGNIVAADARNGHGSAGHVVGFFFLIWTLAFALIFFAIMIMKINKGPLLASVVMIVVAAASYLFVDFNNHGWESNRLLCIGIGGGIGWIMMLNVWGIIWRMNKKIINWTREFKNNATPIPPQSAAMGRLGFLASRTNAWLSLPMLFFMGAASHYPFLGR